MFKEYLGDGLYADFDGCLVLRTENGIETTNEIWIEPPVWEALILYVEKLKEREVKLEQKPSPSYCTKEPFCSRIAGHEGPCDDIPF